MNRYDIIHRHNLILDFLRFSLIYITIVGVILIIVILGGTVFNWYTIDSDEMFFEKKNIKETIGKIVEHDGKLDNIKYVFDSRNIVARPMFTSRKDFMKTHYPENVTLSYVLNDMIVDYYLNADSSAGNTLYLGKLYSLLTENDLTNPFDKLEDSQRYNFENIKCKLDTNYSIVQADVIKITDEINNKNQLVNRYLNKSEQSFNISVIALVLTIIVSCIQFYQNYRSSKRIDNIINGKDSERQKNVRHE